MNNFVTDTNTDIVISYYKNQVTNVFFKCKQV